MVKVKLTTISIKIWSTYNL